MKLQSLFVINVSLNIEVSQLLVTLTNPARCVDNKDTSFVVRFFLISVLTSAIVWQTLLSTLRMFHVSLRKEKYNIYFASTQNLRTQDVAYSEDAYKCGRHDVEHMSQAAVDETDLCVYGWMSDACGFNNVSSVVEK